MKRSFKKISLILLSNLLVLLSLCLLLEAVFRIASIPYKIKWEPSENGLALFDNELGWSYLQNMAITQQFGQDFIKFYFEENGIRIPSPDFRFDYSVPSIIFIGCSFTMGHALNYEDSFVGKFSSMQGENYQVVNLGVQAYGSDQALMALKKFIRKFNTKIVVYTFIEDHIIRNGNYDRRILLPTARVIGTKPIFDIDNKGLLYLKKKPLLLEDYPTSSLFDFLKVKAAELGFSPLPIKLTKEIIRQMKRYSNENNSHFVVINWRWDEKGFKNFSDINADVIDLGEKPPEGWSKMKIFDGLHPDKEASKIAAARLFEYLQNKNLL
jgi:hypothetical protein